MTETSGLSTLGTMPITVDKPSGTSARYEPEFEKLAAEIAKLESVDGRGSIHWDTVVENATAVLHDKSKDLLVGSYLTLGLLQEKGYAGLAEGLAVCKGLLDTFWETLFPEKNRMRARAQALQWMAERITPFLKERSDPSRSDREALTSAVASINGIVEFAGKAFEDGGPALNEFQSAIDYKLASVPSEEAPASADPTPTNLSPSSSTDAASSPSPSTREIDSPDSANTALAEMRERRVKAAKVLREASPTDPLPYRLVRQAVWETLVEAPAAKDGVTEQSGGDAGFLQQQEDRLAKGEYATVLADCEARQSTDPLWLESSFLSWRAMEGLGKPYAAARKALGDEVGRLARSLPALLESKFADGTSMASEAARLWIRHELGGAAGAVAATGLDAAVAEARKLVARKSFPEALGLLQKEARAAASPRDRFLGRLHLARLCAEAGRPEMAIPQLEGLDDEAKRLRLEDWEPSLCADITRELWKAHKTSSTPEKAGEYYARLCRLDLGAALAVDGRK